jgi:hypothetical protein
MSINLPISKLPEFLLSLSTQGHKYAFIKLVSEVKITKKSRTTKLSLNDTFEHPKDVSIVGISKEKEGIYSINADYENMVNARLEKLGLEKDFETKSLPWGEWVKDSKILIIHKGEYYIRLYPFTGDNVLIKASNSAKYFKVYSDGLEIELKDDELEIAKKDFFPVEKPIDETKPIVNCPKLSAIRLIKINSEEYNIKL